MTVDPATWRDVLAAIDTDAPPTLEVADALADGRDLSPGDSRDLDKNEAYEEVVSAFDAGVLQEEGEGHGAVCKECARDYLAFGGREVSQ